MRLSRRLWSVVAAFALVVFALVAVGAMTTTPTEELFGNYNFRVEIDGLPPARFTEVSGLDIATEVIEYQDGDDILLRKRPGRTKYSNITLKRGLTRGEGSSALWDWYQQVIDGKFERRQGRIIVLDKRGEEVARYSFFEAWPCKWKGFTVSETGTDVAVEEIELAVERIERG